MFRKLKRILFLVFLVIIYKISFGQQRLVSLSSKHVCGWNKPFETNSIWEFEVDETDLAKQYVKDICDKEEIEPNFIIRRANVDNAIAVVDEDNNRIIYYSEAFFQTLGNKWYKIAILAHEIGHHINNHTLAKNNRRISDELSADKFAGKILCELGSPFENITELINRNCSTEGSDYYPPKSARLEAILLGYEKGGCESSTAKNLDLTSKKNKNYLNGGNNEKKINNIDFKLNKTFSVDGENTLDGGNKLGISENSSLISVGINSGYYKKAHSCLLRAIDNVSISKTYLGGLFCNTISNTSKILIATDEIEDSNLHVSVYDYNLSIRLFDFTLDKIEKSDIFIAFSPDDNYLVVASENNIYIYDIKLGLLLNKVPCKGAANVSFSQDSKLLAFPNFNQIVLFSLETLKTIKVLPQESKFRDRDELAKLEFIPGRNQIAYTSLTDIVRIIDLDDNKLIREINFSDDAFKILMSKSYGESGKADIHSGVWPSLEPIAVTKDGNYIATSGSYVLGIIKIFTVDGKLVQTINAHSGSVDRILFSKDSKIMVSSSDGSRNNPIRIWKTN